MKINDHLRSTVLALEKESESRTEEDYRNYLLPLVENVKLFQGHNDLEVED